MMFDYYILYLYRIY